MAGKGASFNGAGGDGGEVSIAAGLQALHVLQCLNCILEAATDGPAGGGKWHSRGLHLLPAQKLGISTTKYNSDDSSVHNIRTCFFARATAARQRNTTGLNILDLGQSSETMSCGVDNKLTTVHDFQLLTTEIIKCGSFRCYAWKQCN